MLMGYGQSLKDYYETIPRKLIYIDTEDVDLCNSLSSRYLGIKFACMGSSYLESSMIFGRNDPSIAFLYKFYLRCLSGYRICMAITRNERVLELAKNAIDNDVLRPLLKKFRSLDIGIIIVMRALNEYTKVMDEVLRVIEEVEKVIIKLGEFIYSRKAYPSLLRDQNIQRNDYSDQLFEAIGALHQILWRDEDYYGA